MQKLIYILSAIAMIVFFYIFGVKQGAKFEREAETMDTVQQAVHDTVSGGPGRSSVPAGDTTSHIRRIQTNNQVSNQRVNGITETVSKVKNAVVGINVIQLKKYVRRSPLGFDDPFWRLFAPEMFSDREVVQKVQSLGSGFIISADGYVVTNEHVVEDAAKIIVTTTDGKKHEAKIVGSDVVSDIALLKIDGHDFENIPFGNSDDILIGEWTIALGNPFGLFELNDQPSVTVGVVSATNRDWGRLDRTGRVYLDMIQTDAAINHGNSGGPLVNIVGECIGMNTFIYTGDPNNQGFVGIGFAIPSNKIKSIVHELKIHGKIERDIWTGIQIQTLDHITAEALGIESSGVLVTAVEKDSPAEKAGVKQDDIIISIAGKPVQNTRDAQSILGNLGLKVGDKLPLILLREGKKLHITLTLEKIKEGDRR